MNNDVKIHKTGCTYIVTVGNQQFLAIRHNVDLFSVLQWSHRNCDFTIDRGSFDSLSTVIDHAIFLCNAHAA